MPPVSEQTCGSQGRQDFRFPTWPKLLASFATLIVLSNGVCADESAPVSWYDLYLNQHQILWVLY